MASKVRVGTGMKWYQTIVSIPAKRRGFHKVTEYFSELPFVKSVKMGTMNIMLQHTSASISVNECWDSSVRDDMEMIMNRIVPETAPYTHTLEGSDDMPAHVKCSLMGATCTVPITDGKLNLGTWQGIWLCEHRNHSGSRKLIVTVQGCENES